MGVDEATSRRDSQCDRNLPKPKAQTRCYSIGLRTQTDGEGKARYTWTDHALRRNARGELLRTTGVCFPSAGHFSMRVRGSPFRCSRAPFFTRDSFRPLAHP